MTATQSTSNPYLVGNFAPVRDERDDAALAVSGSIPPELNGLLLRNGPNPIVTLTRRSITGSSATGCSTGLNFATEHADYRNRWVRSQAVCDALGEPAPAGPPAVNGFPVWANTNVIAHASRILALVESGLPTVMRADLSTVGAFDFGGQLTTLFTAHPKIDPVSGELLFFGYDFAPPYVRFHVVDSRWRTVAHRGDRHPPLGHDARLRRHRDQGGMARLSGRLRRGTCRSPGDALCVAARARRASGSCRSGGNADVIWIDMSRATCTTYSMLSMPQRTPLSWMSCATRTHS